ncbi:hypothetical protein GQ44DRAFT_778091 [Phaeosphaeriaceae sp. PMI808]|nr:hypothetical protein GQ44DRAFT_778091 [Phaeosphaeriaceae sp. PMI808]
MSPTSHPSQVLPREEGRVWTAPQDSNNGFFLFPRTYPITFREGSSINISWSTTYTNINLYFYQRGKVVNSVQLGMGGRTKETNLTNPFVFRVVNSQGTTEEQSNGGFWSTSWYLARDENLSESVISLSSAASSSSSTATTTTTTTTTSSTASSSRETSSQISISKTQGIPDGGFGKGTIIGLTVGLVVAGTTIIAALFYYLKKRNRSKEVPYSAPSLDVPYHDMAQAHTQPEYRPVHENFAQPSELQGGSPCQELPGTK